LRPYRLRVLIARTSRVIISYIVWAVSAARRWVRKYFMTCLLFFFGLATEETPGV
jgi:hypothetical protein